jgi:hypothetical protein
MLHALCCGGSWPYNIHYQPRRWTHPEFAVQGGLRIDPGSVRIQFEPHGTGVCVKTWKREKCLDCSSGGPARSSGEARARFIATVIAGGRTAAQAVQAFLSAWPEAFDEPDRTAIAAAIAHLQ